MAEERGVVKYQSRDGQEITLSFNSIKNYLVSGKKENVTDQELMYFMAICKSRGLNPFKKDAYLIKYGNDPAAIVTSIDYFRSRARAQKDCVGWKKGVIVKTKDGALRDSAGLIQEGETLLGGFFEATPSGWKDPFRLEVNLKGYIKKTSEGKVTRFWSEDNQPSQIAKVAESQGLRTLWPDEFQGVYEETEIKAGSDIEMQADKNGTYAEPINTDLFEKYAASQVHDTAQMTEFLSLSAKTLGKTEAEIKYLAQNDLPDFWKQFTAWQKKQAPVQQEAPKAEQKGKKGKNKLELKPEAPLSAAPILCPDNDKYVTPAECPTCKKREGCPAWEPEPGSDG